MASAADALHSPVDFLSAMLGANLPDEPVLRAYEAACRRVPVAELAEGTPNADDIRKGYAAGVVWRGYVQETALPIFLLMYIAAFHDPRLVDVYTPTLIVTQMVDKYAPEPIRSEWLTRLKARDGSTPQGMVWVKAALTPGPSPGGRGEETIVAARPDETEPKLWRLSGRIDAPRNFDAEIAVVAASVGGADAPTLFLVPSFRVDGRANFQASADEATFDGSEAWMLGEVGDGSELIEEIAGFRLSTNGVGSVALIQRIQSEESTVSDGSDVTHLTGAFSLVWATVDLLNWTWREMPNFASDTARLFRLLVRLAGYYIYLLTNTLNESRSGQKFANRFDDQVTLRPAALFMTAARVLRKTTVQQSLLALLKPYNETDFDEAFVRISSISKDEDLRDGIGVAFFHLCVGTGQALARRLDAARAIAGDSISA